MERSGTSTWLSIGALAFGILLLSRPSNAETESPEERLDRLWSAPYTPTKMEWLAVLLRAGQEVLRTFEPLHVNFNGRRSLVVSVQGSAKNLEEHFWKKARDILWHVQLSAHTMDLPPPQVFVWPVISDGHTPDLEQKYKFYCTPKALPRNVKDQLRQTLDTICPDLVRPARPAGPDRR